MKGVWTAEWQYVTDRARSSFLGVALGDALGATTEFMTPREIRAAFGVHDQIVGGGWLYLKPGQVTDDTEMSISIARAIRKSGGWYLPAIAEAFADWMRGRPVDIGSTCARGIRNNIIHGTLSVPENRWDAGNGALMRMAPVAIYTLGEESLLCRYALEQAHLTHNNGLSDAACACIGRMVHQGILGASMKELQGIADDLVSMYPVFRYQPYPGNSSAYVVDTVQTVFHFLFSTQTFEECLVKTVNQGGDADTTGAVAGMVAGAVYGSRGIPGRWMKRLNATVSAEIDDLAAYLVSQSPAGIVQKQTPGDGSGMTAPGSTWF